MDRIIKRDRSIIPACDVDLEHFEKIMAETADIEEIGAYKIPATSGRKGWENWIKTAKKYTDKPLIYDHQKAGTDIPDTGEIFMREAREAGFDAVILVPQAGPATEKSWIEAAQQQGLGVIVGGLMTHPNYKKSESGYIDDDAVQEMYDLAFKLGVVNFVVPGNKPEAIQGIIFSLKQCSIGKDLHNAVSFYAPGFVAQGGRISDAVKVITGYCWHAIIGRGIYEAEDIRAAALEYVSQI